MSKLSQFAARRSRLFWLLASLLLTVLIGILDYATGPELGFSIFYLFPVALAAWYSGRAAGFCLSVFCAAFWLVDEQLTAVVGANALLAYWNAVVRLEFYLLVTVAVTQLEAARQLERALTEFVVHDLKSPLITIGMALRILRRGPAADDPEQLRLIEMAQASTERTASMVSSLLDVSRLERHRMPLSPQATEPAELVRVAVDQLHFWAESEGLTIGAEVAEGAPLVRADRDVIIRVLVNLIGNAIKHGPSGSRIEVRAAPAGSGSIRFDVTDYGPGIPRHWAKRVFRRHAQVEARKEGAAVGTGLGLTFCRLAVVSHGGRIWVDSEPGKRTTFSFELPVADTEAGAQEPQPSPETQGEPVSGG